MSLHPDQESAASPTTAQANTGTQQTASANKPVTGQTLLQMRQNGEKIAMLTCYDASFAAAMDSAGVDALLIGDSLGMVTQGHRSTLPVTLRDMAYHTEAVVRGTKRAMVIADLPFGTYGTPEQALASAVLLMQAGAQMVKLEGGHWLLQTVHMLVERGIPVCAHLGLTPQSVHTLGGYKVQGREKSDANKLTEDAIALQHAGASLVVLEAIPATLGTSVTESISVPTIGIGAGSHCSGQVLVMHDMLGVYPGHRPKFVKNFMEGQSSIHAALKSYVTSVKDSSFPGIDHIF